MSPHCDILALFTSLAQDVFSPPKDCLSDRFLAAADAMQLVLP